MKHRVLLEFSAFSLPDDFLDQIAGRVYGHPAVDKKECTAAFVGDVLKDAERYQHIKKEIKVGSVQTQLPLYKVHYWMSYEDAKEFPELDAAIDAAKDTQ